MSDNHMTQSQNPTPATLPDDLLEHLIDTGNQALNDHYHDELCACSAWPASCLTPGITPGQWDTNAFAIALPAIIAAYQQHQAQQPGVEPSPVDVHGVLATWQEPRSCPWCEHINDNCGACGVDMNP